jgi:hypothetical protein
MKLTPQSTHIAGQLPTAATLQQVLTTAINRELRAINPRSRQPLQAFVTLNGEFTPEQPYIDGEIAIGHNAADKSDYLTHIDDKDTIEQIHSVILHQVGELGVHASDLSYRHGYIMISANDEGREEVRNDWPYLDEDNEDWDDDDEDNEDNE